MPRSELTASAGRAAQALAQSLTERLGVDDCVDGDEVYRSARTLSTLIQPLVDDRLAGADLATLLDEVMTVLTIRVGEAVDAGREDETYQLGRALDVLGATRRRCHRRAATA